jgi:triphosphatase
MAEPESSEFELKFSVPAAARAAVFAEVSGGAGFQGRQSLAAMYLDTPDGRLAAAGLAWRLRRESRRWVQTLKAGGSGPLLRFEHEVPRPTATPDAQLHAGTAVGDRLLALLRQADADGMQPGLRFRTEVRRSRRVIRTRGAVVELALDEGRIVAGELERRVLELEFECLSGSRAAMLDLARRWQRRFGLLMDPHSKSERGSLLAQGLRHPAVRKAGIPRYPAKAGTDQAFAAVLDECLDQVLRNAAGLCDGASEQRVDHVHQLRVGLRRLRSAFRSFRGWVQTPPPALQDGLRGLFAELGRARDGDVMDSGVAAALAAVGAPALPPRRPAAISEPGALLRAPAVQALLLDLVIWRTTGQDPRPAPTGAGGTQAPRLADVTQALSALAPQPDPDRATSARHESPSDSHRRRARKRLRAWHQTIAQQAQAFETLDESSLHALRKRIKRQRYAVEFLAPLLPRRALSRYLKLLARAQERMGELNDLFVARAHYQARVADEPAAWFALGWLAARIAEVAAAGRPALLALAEAVPPRP